MSSELKKDVILLCINNIGICFIHVWTVVYPYYASYLHSMNDSITPEKIFASLIFFYFGNLVGNAIDPYFI